MPNRFSGSRIVAISKFVVLVLALLWPAFINGGPFWFPDTSTYIRGADAAAVFLTGIPTEWSDRLIFSDDVPASVVSATAVSDATITPARPVLAGRSIYYGFLIYIPMRLLGPWAAVAVQALLVASVLWFSARIALRHLPPTWFPWQTTANAALVFLTPLPFYASMLMPDVYSGLLILMLVLAFVSWTKLSWRERVLLTFGMAVFATFHTSNLLIAIALAIVAVVLETFRGRRLSLKAMIPAAIATPAVIAALVGSVAFNAAVLAALDQPPMSPPFLSARITAAGPGERYLDNICENRRDAFELCNHRGRLSQWSDAFLWGQDEHGLFQLATPAQQRRMANEDKEFYLAVARYDPLGVAIASLKSTVLQLVSFSLLEFNVTAGALPAPEAKYPPAIGQAIDETLAARSKMPTRFTVLVTVLSSIASIMGIVWIAVNAGARLWRERPEIIRLTVLILVAIIINATICGSFSGAHPRYQMRLIWLLPWACALLLAGRLFLSPTGPAATSLLLGGPDGIAR